MKFLLNSWTWKMVWRETRATPKRLTIYICSMALGVAAVVAIQSFGDNLNQAMNQQAKALLGADLVIRSRQPLTNEAQSLIESLGGKQSREVRFSSMVRFPNSNTMRLVQVRALEKNFPYYGRLTTEPHQAAQTFFNSPAALIDDRILQQYAIKIGDSVKIGEATFIVAGKLTRIPGEAIVTSLIAPKIYISISYLEQTQLVQKGSRISYRTYFKFKPKTDVEQLVKNIQPALNQYHLRSETVEEQKKDIGRPMENSYLFLDLVALVALLLGSIGIASAVHVHIKQKLETVSTLHCLGVPVAQTFYIYVLQTVVMGLIGVLLGSLLGTLAQQLMPKILTDFLPLEVPIVISWKAIFQAAFMGFSLSVLFALLPLSVVLNISPLNSLRLSYENQSTTIKNPMKWLIGGLIVVTVYSFILMQSKHWSHGIWFLGTIVGVFSVLGVLSWITVCLVRRFFPHSWSYIWRQGLANLYRPNNQTVILIMTIGLSTFLIATLVLVQNILVKQVLQATSEGKANLVLFDIQTDQRQTILDMVQASQLPILQDVPIVTMRLSAINEIPVEEISANPDSEISKWALLREYRSTYREHLTDSEKIIAGKWLDKKQHLSTLNEISLEERIAERLGVSLGDQLVFDVQGVPIETTIGSIRRVEWRRIQTNFFVLFPPGILEKAPQFHVLATRTDSAHTSAILQRSILNHFPNVSAIDLSLVLKTLDDVLHNMAFVIRCISLFSIFAGLLVLVGSIANSRYQRVQESILLRTLGASQNQIIQITVVEYFFLGILAATTGLILSIVFSWALARFLFEVNFSIEFNSLMMIFLAVTTFVLLLGGVSNLGLCRRPPLEILRTKV